MTPEQFTSLTDEELAHIEGQLAACDPEYHGKDRGLISADLMRILNIQSHLTTTYVPRMVASLRVQKEEIAAIRAAIAAGTLCDDCKGQGHYLLRSDADNTDDDVVCWGCGGKGYHDAKVVAE